MSKFSLRVSEKIYALAEINGRTLTWEASAMILDVLAKYSEPEVLAAIDKCAAEVRGMPTIADIVQRIQLNDGRPGVEEAWAMVPKGEDATVVWTAEMCAAWGTAYSLIVDDPIAGRMAFKEKYLSLVSEARSKRVPVRWQASLGHDPEQRKRALREAVALKRLPHEEAEGVCAGYTELAPPKLNALLDGPKELATVDPSKMIAKIIGKIEESK